MNKSDALWRQCGTWIKRFNLIPANHPALKNNSKLQDLLQLLRNGVVLCQLANALDPNSIDLTKVIYFPPEDNSVEDFVCRNNIFLFVRSLVTHFHLDTEICFFDPPCLYEYQDIGKVFRSLSALSWSEASQKFGIPGFPAKEHKLEKKLETEESLYSEVRSLYDKVGPSEDQIYSSSRNSGEDSQDKIYDSVISPKQRKVGSLFSPKKSKRDHPIQEMIDTERTYLDNLLMVRDCFRDRISLLDADTKNEIFYGLDEMIHLHSFLQRDLSVCEKDVGRVLLKYLNQFSVYKVYCTKLSSNQAFLQNQEKSNPKLNAELVRCRLEANSSFPLSAHIVIPFQRLLKYHLMLEGILKHTDSDHPHYCNLILAKEAFIELNKEINDLKGQMEKDEKLIQADLQALTILEKVEKSIRCMHLPASSRLQEYGKMVRAGNLATHGHQGTADYAFLLHTIIIFATKPKILQHRFRFKFALKLKDYNIEHTGDCIKLTNTLNVFSSLILTTKRPSELRMWEHDLVECKSLIAPVNPRGHSLVLTNLPGKTCAHCYNKIVGALGQAYKCNTCDAAIHLSCLPDISWCHMANNDDFSFRRFGSMMLPIQLQGDRGSMGSTLSLACVNIDNKDTVRELRQEWSRERENIPLEAQPWFAGNLTSSTATTRLNSLPLATFLVREQLEDGQGDVPSEEEMHGQQDELPPLPFFGNNDAFLPFSDSMEAISTILGQQELWSPESMQRTTESFEGETSESDPTEENYDHLLRDYTKEFLPVPDSFNIADHLAVDYVYVPGEDDHYRGWADNVMDMAKSLDRSPESVYQDMLGIPDQGFHAGLPYDPYSYDMMDPLMYDPEYLHFLEVQAALEHQQYLQFLQMQGMDDYMMWPSIQVSSGTGGPTGYNRMIHSDAELHPSYYENYS